MNLVLSCVGKRGYIADYFREVLPAGSNIVGTSNTHWTPGFASCDVSVVLPPIASDEYVPALIQECQKHDVSGLISMFDPDVHRLSAHREDFARAGVVAVLPTREASTIAFDKLETWRFLSGLGLHVPLTTSSLDEALAWIDDKMLSLPLVVKPRYGFGSANTFVARTAKEVMAFHRYAADMLVQQFVHGDALNVDGLGDLRANPLSVVPWRKLLSRMGETERSVTIDCPELIDLAERIIREVGIIGPFDADCFMDDSGELWVLELNARFGGGYPVSHLAGAAFPKLIVRMIEGDEFTPPMIDYKRGVTMMKKLSVIPGPALDAI